MFFSFRSLLLLAVILTTSALTCSASTQLDLNSLGAVATQSSGSGAPASRAIDGNAGTFSETSNLSNSFWQVTLARKVQISQVQLVVPAASFGSNLVMRIYDLRDQTIFQATVSDVAPDGTWSTNLPPGIYGRGVRFGLENGQTNGQGNFLVAISEVRLFGDPSAIIGPTEMAAVGTATESSTSSSAALAIDGNPDTASATMDVTNSYWLLTFGSGRAVQRLELVNPTANPAQLQGLTVRILDNNSNSIASTTVPSVGAGANWVYTPPTTITNALYIKIGLENGVANGAGNHVVSLAEVNVLSTTNVGAGKPAYMTRDSDTLPPNSNVNDDNYATIGGTTGLNTHDFYWEMNLGQPFALYSVRIVTASGEQLNLTNASLTILDDNYNEIYFHPLTNSTPTEVCDVALPSPMFGQFVRISYEYAQRSGGNGSGASWFLDMREVQAYGRPTNEVGLLSFTATQTNISSGASTTLQWQENDLSELDLYPNYGSVGSNTLVGGAGSLMVSPTNSTEYTLVGLAYSNNFPQQLTIEVNGQILPPQISEFMANNTLTLQDGNNNYSDWIELHNPNNTTLDISGDYLSDDPTAQTKWQFPSGTTISPHGYLLVFADSASTNYDPAGYLHANFSLNDNGESVVLTANNGVTVLDGITNFPAQMADLSYARTLNGQWTFMDPTPVAPNIATNYIGWLADLDFDHKRGWYTNAFTLVISNSNPGATVYWSTNGYEPTNVYTGPLTVANTVGMRASIKETGYKSPRIKTHTYLFLNDIVNQTVLSTTYTLSSTYSNRLRQGFLDLPILSINVPPADPKYAYLAYNDERPDRTASVEFFMPDGSNIQQDCALVHLGGQFGTGAAGTLYAKKTWQLNFGSEYGASWLEFPLFAGFDHGILAHDKFKELDIHAGNQDQEGYGSGSSRGFYMSHAFALDSMLDMGDLNPHSRFIQVFTNGVYMGQFCMNERLTDAMLSQYLGGSKDDYLTVKGNDNTGSFGFIPGVADGPDRSAYDYVRSNMNSYATIKSWVDVTNDIDYMLMWQWGNAEAEFRSAMPRTAGKGGFKVWLADADGLVRQPSGVSGQLSKNDVSNPAQANTVFTWGPGWIFSNLLQEANPDFKTLLADRIYKNFFNNGAMTPAQLQARLDARMAEVTNSMVDECARWANNYTSTFNPAVWQTDAQYARDNLLPFRGGTLVSQMRAAGWYPSFDPPTLSQYGGSVSNGYQLTVTGPAGMTIYYTLDGSDPRLPGGGISPTAIAWTSGTSIINVVNIPLGSTWRYYNTNAAPTGGWTSVNYDDSAWQSGATPAGYPQGDDGVTFATVLNYGTDPNNKWVSYYFRQKFVVTNLAGITNMTLGLNRDDGAVVYLNGTELLRDNMPAGVITNGTLAATTVSGTNETNVFIYSVPANLLTTGTNVVAVEVHQDLPNSTDIHFNLSLFGSVTNNNGSALTLTLTNATTFTARTFDGTNWSALDSANFILAPLRQPNPGDLIISELNYHPPDSENYEFVELYNTTSNQLDLTGVQLTGGITYLFPNGFSIAPNSFALAVKSLSSFASRYQTTNSPYYYPNLNVTGPYSGKLSNSGDTVILTASNGVELCEVSYQTSGAWPTRADGEGSSLELADLNAATATGTNIDAYLARGLNWKASSLFEGSPGRFDSAPQNIVISELLAHTDLTKDWIEFQNLSASPIDLGGLYLSDNYSNVFRYYIPANTIVTGNGFLALSTTNFGFAFSEHGESAVLTQASGTNVIRFIDSVDFPASDDEISFGRYTRSDGVVDFTELRANTEGTNNALPLVGPCVFSEIMYKPATNMAEFVEIVNLAPTNLPLYDPNWPTNTWQLAGGISFTFPTNQQIAGHSAIIVCNTNAATFRDEYNVDPSVPVYGPYSGALNNAGDDAKLEFSGVPETNGFVPYYRMDHLRYEPVAPWPTNAYSGGISLERVTLEGYADDPINWQSSSVSNGTPGTFIGNRPPNLSVIGNATVYEGDTVSLAAQASDFDQPWQTLALSAQNLPNGSSFDTNSGIFSWPTVETNGPGVYNLQFVVADNGVHQMMATQIVAVTVLESNSPPWLQAVTNILFPAQIPFALDLVATDADWPPNILTFAASGLPIGLNLNPASGQIRGAAQTPGLYPIYYSVTDNGTPPLSASNTFTLTIAQPFVAGAFFTGGTTAFSFQSLAGENYDVQYSPSLSPANWQLLEHITNTPGGFLTISNPPAGTQGFIRVIWDH